MNKGLLEEFKQMPLAELKEFVEANDQPSFEKDSKVRLLLNKHTPLGKREPGYGITFALTEMYIALSHALYERLNESETAIGLVGDAFKLMRGEKTSELSTDQITDKALEFVKTRGLETDMYWLDCIDDEALTEIIDEGEAWFSSWCREIFGHYPSTGECLSFRSEVRRIREEKRCELIDNE